MAIPQLKGDLKGGEKMKKNLSTFQRGSKSSRVSREATSSRPRGFTQHHFRSGRLGSQVKKHKNGAGFTLLELLVVIAIIGLLSTLAIVALNSARQKARDAKRVADIKQVQTALELYFNDQSAYPAGTTLALGAGTDCTTACDTISSTNGIAATVAGTTYMGLIPADPSAATGSECILTTSAVCHYSYTRVAASTVKYELLLYLEGATGSLLAGVNCATEAGIASTCTH